MNTFSIPSGNSVEYVNQTLIVFNVVYNNGGGGIHIFFSEDVTVANNSCANDAASRGHDCAPRPTRLESDWRAPPAYAGWRRENAELGDES
jgi:parallel beta-helix repeat protein